MDKQAFWNESRKAAQVILDKYQIEIPPIGFHIGLGWIPIVDQALEEMISAGWNKDLVQVKQKLCGLRIYIGSASDAVHAIVQKAEQKAGKVCEVCGVNHGHDYYINGSFGMALCETCKKDWT